MPSPTTREVVVTTPYIPGLELHLPPQTRLEGEDGRPVTQVSLTPIPVDRPPFPLPTNVAVPTYFTAQPGGAYVYGAGVASPGAWLVYPNYHASAGELAQFHHYDPKEKDWYVYGTGQVTPDAKQVVPTASTRVYAFTGAMMSSNDNPAPEGPGSCQVDGNPVDLRRG